MPRVYELPTHLEVEDQLIAGLTARQLLRLAFSAALAYLVWDQVRWLPDEVRLALALVLSAIGALFALVQPAGRPLDHWLVIGVLFLVLPRRLGWYPGAASLCPPSREPADWAELELDPDWLGPAVTTEGAEKSMPRKPFSLRFIRRWRWMKR